MMAFHFINSQKTPLLTKLSLLKNNLLNHNNLLVLLSTETTENESLIFCISDTSSLFLHTQIPVHSVQNTTKKSGVLKIYNLIS